MSVETVEKEYGSPPEVRRWFEELDLAAKEEKDWRVRADKVVKRYRDEQEAKGSQFNILWANTETLRPALYSSTPKPDVQRRYKDSDPIGGAAAKVLERAVSFSVDCEDFDGTANQVITDYLLPGRAVARIRYKPVMAEMDGLQKVVYEEAPTEYVNWKRFRMSPAECWAEVRWIAFQSFMTRDEMVSAFGAEGHLAPLTIAADGERVEDKDEVPDEFYLRAEIWEIWDKESRRVYFVATSHDKYLDIKDDPLTLKDFFPIPKPLYALETNGSMIPVPEFCLYQDQADELNLVTARITNLVDALKVRGIYDASFKTTLQELLNGGENQMVPVEGWSGIAEKGGMDGVVGWMPIEQIGKVLAAMYQKRGELIDTIYQLTGISDIQRGSTDARETKGAQQLKAQFGSRRLIPRQQAVQRFFRDLYRLKAEVIGEHFAPETLAAMTGVPVEQIALVQPVISSDVLRAFKVDIETDSTVAPDEMADKQAVSEFMAGMQQFIGTIAPLVQEGAMSHDVAKAMMLAAARRNKFGREVEQALEAMAPPPPKPDPKAAQMQAEMQMEQARMQMEMQKVQAEAQLDQQKHAAEIQFKQAELQFKQAELELKKQELQMKLQAEAASLQLEQQKIQMEGALKAKQAEDDIALKTQQAQADLALKAQEAQQNMALKEQECQHKAALESQKAEQDMALKAATVQQDGELKKAEFSKKVERDDKESAHRMKVDKEHREKSRESNDARESERVKVETQIAGKSQAALAEKLDKVLTELVQDRKKPKRKVVFTRADDGRVVAEEA